MLPGPSYQALVSTSPITDQASESLPITPLAVPDSRDTTLKEYNNWQQSKVDDHILKAEFQKACDVALADGRANRGPGSWVFRRQGRFVSDIKHWVKEHKMYGMLDSSI
jgi:hypothetical protein